MTLPRGHEIAGDCADDGRADDRDNDRGANLALDVPCLAGSGFWRWYLLSLAGGRLFFRIIW